MTVVQVLTAKVMTNLSPLIATPHQSYGNFKGRDFGMIHVS